MRWRRSSFICSLVLGLLLTSCAEDVPERPPPSIAAETTASTVADPYAVPAVIDAAYIDKVLAKLGEIRNAAIRDVATTKTYSDLTDRRLRSIYTGDALEFQLDLFKDAALVEQPVEALTADKRYRTVRIHRARPTCIWLDAEIRSDDDPDPGVLGYVLQTGEHDRSMNPTPWLWAQATDRQVLERLQPCV